MAMMCMHVPKSHVPCAEADGLHDGLLMASMFKVK